MWRLPLGSEHLECSSSLCEILGINPTAAGVSFDAFLDRVHPEDRDDVRRSMSGQLVHNMSKRQKYRLWQTGGHYLSVLVTMVSLPAAKSMPKTLFGIVANVTAEPGVSERLIESEKRLKALSDNVSGAIYLYRIAPDGTHSIDFMNRGSLSIWELDVDELTSNPGRIRELVVPEDVPALQAAISQSRETGGPLHHRWRIQTPSGLLKHLDGRATPEFLPDGTVQWNCLVVDVTEAEAIREELARQQVMLAQSQKMEAVGRIAGGIAHDFNNLLAVIMGNAELLGNDATAAPIQSEILDACQRGADLTQRLLSFARRAPLAPALADINSAISGMESMISRVLPENIAFSVDLQANLKPCEIDAAFFESAILNLVINARDAMPRGGRLSITTNVVELDWTDCLELSADMKPGAYAKITLLDSGAGISEELLDKVVEPFVTTKRNEQASGLGLAMVHGFANQSRGALRIESSEGIGTSVSIFLPTVNNSIQLPVGKPPAEVSKSKPDEGVILVVEDEPAVLGVVGTLLSQQGFTVRIASSGDAAIEYFRNGRDSFDLLLTDVMMPGKIDGPALASRCLQEKPDLKVIFMSGYAHHRDLASLGRCDGFLTKPVLQDELLSSVRRAIAK